MYIDVYLLLAEVLLPCRKCDTGDELLNHHSYIATSSCTDDGL